MVDFELSLQLRNTLQQQLGSNVTGKEYNNAGHWIKEPEVFNDLGFLAVRFCVWVFRGLEKTSGGSVSRELNMLVLIRSCLGL